MNRYNITLTFFNGGDFRFMAIGDSLMDAQWKVFASKQIAEFVGNSKIKSMLIELAEEDIDTNPFAKEHTTLSPMKLL